MAGNEGHKPARSWAEELRRLSQRLKDVGVQLDVEKTHLADEWDKGKETSERWQSLRNERDRVLIIKTELGWLSIDAAARVDRRLRTAGETIDRTIESKVTEAALRLRQAEHIMQRAWWSRRWNTWPSPWIVPMWAFLLVMLLGALAASFWLVFDKDLFPRGREVELDDALYAATLWGLAGALVNGLRTLHQRVQAQEFEIERLLWYVASPAIGAAFGAIAFVALLAGLLSTGQELESATAQTAQQQAGDMAKVVDPTPVLLLALLAGLGQNAFFSFLQASARVRFGAVPEEDTGA